MPGTVNLSNELESFETGMDSVVIRRKGGRIIGGRSLNMEGFNEKYVKAGHIIIRSTNDEYDYKPMPVSDNAYSSLPENYEYAGIWVRRHLQVMQEEPSNMTERSTTRPCPTLLTVSKLP